MKLISQQQYYQGDDLIAPTTHNKLRVVVISDTHLLTSYMKPLPKGDILLHCGDFTNLGTLCKNLKYQVY